MFVEHKEAGEVVEAPAKVMKVSEAMRLGATLRHQCTNAFFKDGGSCALGAAMEAYGYGPNIFPWPTYEDAIPILNISAAMAEGIAVRNDLRGMTREQIADWLESKGY